MMNVNTCDWDDQALELANVDRSQLPEIVNGTTQADWPNSSGAIKNGHPC